MLVGKIAYKRALFFVKSQFQTSSHLRRFSDIKDQAKMSSYFGKTVAIFFIVAFICIVITTTEATYRKPPFNGSIFGKRAGSNNEYDSASKALSAMCEIANEACQSWFPNTQEK